MADFLYNMLLMSMSGTIMFLLATLLYKQTKSKYARWYYALIITSVALFILPLHGVLQIPKAFIVEVPESMAVYSDSGIAVIPQNGIDVSYIIFTVWALGAIALIGFNVYSYIRTRSTLMGISRVTLDTRALCACREAERMLGIKKNIRVRKSDMLRSPLLFGVLTPTVILPDVHFSDSELKMVFAHELTHYKHRDILVKLISIFASSLHWFNPCVYFMKNAINNGCELCCDETVLSVLDLADKKQYGRLLLSIIEGSKGGFAYTTAMSSKQSIKQRLTKIVEFRRMSLPVKMVSVMLALSMTVCSVTAFGFDVVKENLPESVSRAIDQPHRSDIDASGAYIKAETPMPDEAEEQTETQGSPEPTEAPVDVTEAYEVQEQPLVYETAAVSEAHEDYTSAAAYTPVYTAPESVETYAMLPERAEEMAEEDYHVDEAVSSVSFPDTSYMFSPSFSGGKDEKVMSSLITVTRDAYMYISADRQAKYSYGLYSADGKLLLSDNQMVGGKIPVKAGSEYYLIAESSEKCEGHIYVYAN